MKTNFRIVHEITVDHEPGTSIDYNSVLPIVELMTEKAQKYNGPICEVGADETLISAKACVKIRAVNFSNNCDGNLTDFLPKA